ncbi:MAG: hypothetical protein ACLVBP_09890 [Ruminococcus sp.]
MNVFGILVAETYEMHPAPHPKISCEIDYEKIVAFCKARNAITHRGENDNFDEDIAKRRLCAYGINILLYIVKNWFYATDENNGYQHEKN